MYPNNKGISPPLLRKSQFSLNVIEQMVPLQRVELHTLPLNFPVASLSLFDLEVGWDRVRGTFKPLAGGGGLALVNSEL